jgi:hypothetical protein
LAAAALLLCGCPKELTGVKINGYNIDLTKVPDVCKGNVPNGHCSEGRELLPSSWSEAAESMSMENETVTYHNDSPSERSNTIQLMLPQLLTARLPQTVCNVDDQGSRFEPGWSFDPSNTRFQHTHGTESTLYVMKRPCGTCDAPDIRAYRIEREDRIYVWFGGFKKKLGHCKPHGRLSDAPQQRIIKVNSKCMETPKCHNFPKQNPSDPLYLGPLFWKIDTSTPMASKGSVKLLSQDVDYEQFDSTQPTYLRQIVIRKKDGKMGKISIDTPCAGFKLCYRPVDCPNNNEPFCLLEPQFMPKNEFCPACPAP